MRNLLQESDSEDEEQRDEIAQTDHQALPPKQLIANAQDDEDDPYEKMVKFKLITPRLKFNLILPSQDAPRKKNTHRDPSGGD